MYMKQGMSDTPARLRQRLRAKLAELERLVEPAFDRSPVFPGNVYLSRHRCGKDSCRCATRDELHETLRLQIRFQDGTANRCLSEERADFWRPRTDAYRELREAQRAFRKWQKEVSEILSAIERERKSSEGLEAEDRGRALR